MRAFSLLNLHILLLLLSFLLRLLGDGVGRQQSEFPTAADLEALLDGVVLANHVQRLLRERVVRLGEQQLRHSKQRHREDRAAQAPDCRPEHQRTEHRERGQVE